MLLFAFSRSSGFNRQKLLVRSPPLLVQSLHFFHRLLVRFSDGLVLPGSWVVILFLFIWCEAKGPEQRACSCDQLSLSNRSIRHLLFDISFFTAAGGKQRPTCLTHRLCNSQGWAALPMRRLEWADWAHLQPQVSEGSDKPWRRRLCLWRHTSCLAAEGQLSNDQQNS